MAVKQMVQVDAKKVRAALNEKGIPLTKASYAAGYKAKNSLATCLSRGEIPEINFRLLCLTYGLDPETLKAAPPTSEADAPEDKPVTGNTGIETQLARIADALEAIVTTPDFAEKPTLTKIERCVLLLKQMTCYGGCQRADFEAKALEYGMSPEMQDMAIRMTKLKPTTKNGADWLSKT